MTELNHARDFAVERTRDFAPLAPGSVLRDRVLKGMRITQQELADALRVSRFTVNQILNGRRAITPDMAVRLGSVLDTSPDVWLKLQMRYDLFGANQRLADELKTLRKLRVNSGDEGASSTDE
jgi:addiction module HigA family antidote